MGLRLRECENLTMATQASDLISTGIPGALPSHGPFPSTGQGSGYQPPAGLSLPSVQRTPAPGAPSNMPTTSVPEAWTPSGLFPGQTGYTFPQARILSIPVQKLAGTTDIYAASTVIPFPFVVRSCVMWAPASVIGGSSDGVMDVRVGQDTAANATAFGSGVSILYPPAVPRLIYCPLPVTLGELWVPFAEGHQFMLVHAQSLGGATNIQLVCMVGISPLDDFIGA